MRSIQTIAVCAFLTFGSIAIAGGNFSTEAFHCQKNADSSGSCFGTLAGVRASSNANDFVDFFDTSSGSTSRSFYASISSVTYQCVTSPTYPGVNAIWPEMMDFRGYIYITWDSGSACNYLELASSSEYYY